MKFLAGLLLGSIATAAGILFLGEAAKRADDERPPRPPVVRDDMEAPTTDGRPTRPIFG